MLDRAGLEYLDVVKRYDKWDPSFIMPTPMLEQEKQITVDLNSRIGLGYLRSLWREIHINKKSILASFDGRHRSGKSLTATTWGALLDPTFYPNMENRIVHDAESFLEVYRSEIAKKGIKGAVVIIDEAGVVADSTQWYDKMMKSITNVIQVFGYLHPIVFFCVPIKDFVLKKVRQMMHYYFSVRRYDNSSSIAKPYNIMYNTVRAKVVYRKPRVSIDGRLYVINGIKTTLPPQFIIEKYRDLEVKRKTEVFERVSVVDEKEEKKEWDMDEVEKIIEAIVQEPERFKSLRQVKGKVTLDLMAIKLFFRINDDKIAKFIKERAEKRLQENKI